MGGSKRRRRICFVTGSRAEFGLMRTTLLAIQRNPLLHLDIVATGMHLDKSRGESLNTIKQAGFTVTETVAWNSSISNDPKSQAINTARAIEGILNAIARLRTDIVLVVGDRVEAFAAAAAAHLCQIPVAHVHGGDRALGEIDDSLRHAITKLSHIHFPVTRDSANRIAKLGEDNWRIHCVGSPGNDGIAASAAPCNQIARQWPLKARRFALLCLHPASQDKALEKNRASIVLEAVEGVGFDQIIILYPNNDPGSDGIVSCWDGIALKKGGMGMYPCPWLQHNERQPRARVLAHATQRNILILPDLPRSMFLGLLRDAAVLVGNSSAGIIEAAAFGTPVLDIGPRQQGRQRSKNVVHCDYNVKIIKRELARIWDGGNPRRARCKNVFGGDGAGERIARILAHLKLGDRLLTKLISY